MTGRSQFRQPARHALLGAVLACVLGVGFWASLPGDGLVNLSYDLPFYFRPDRTNSGVVVLYMDLKSHTALGQPRFGQRWDRAIHARLLDRLTEWHAKVVAFDVLFLGPGDPTAADDALARAAKRHGRVAVASIVSPEFHEGQPIGSQVLGPFASLGDNAAVGVVEVADASRFIRQHYSCPLHDAPSLAWKAAALSGAALPSDPFRERWLNYYCPPGRLIHYSVSDVLETNNVVPAAAFSNQVVFVGALYSVGYTGGKGTDDLNTPYTRWTDRKSPGVDINATACLNLVQGDWLSRLPKVWELALLLLSGAAFGGGLAFCRPMRAAGLGLLGVLLVTTTAMVSVWQTHVWFPWLIVVVVQMPVAVGWSILAHTKQLQREQRTLEQRLALASRGEPEPASQTAVVAAPAVLAKNAGGVPTEPAATAPLAVPDHELLRPIGKGAYGEVWLARDILGTFHAVKIVHGRNFEDARPLEREFNGLKKFTPISRSHPGFVHILHVGRDDKRGCFYYVMELADAAPPESGKAGERESEQWGPDDPRPLSRFPALPFSPASYAPRTLDSELRRRGRLPLAETLDLAIHLADALEHLHRQQLIHRDIKPTNIIYVNGVAKFADIGLVTDIATGDDEASYLGTPGRIAPEGPGTPAADVFSLGKVLYEMAFGLDLGRFPELPTGLIDSGGEENLFQLNRIIMRACEMDVRRRYPTAAALRADLLALQQRAFPKPPPR